MENGGGEISNPLFYIGETAATRNGRLSIVVDALAKV